MRLSDSLEEVSIRYTLKLEDGTLVSRDAGGNLFDYTRHRQEVLPVLEEALRKAKKGERISLVLSPEADPKLRLHASRLALLVGHPGETLILEVEVL